MKLPMIPCVVTLLSRVPRSSSFYISAPSSLTITATTTTKTTTTSSRLYSSPSSSSESMTTITKSDGPEIPPVPSTSKRLFMVRHGEVINPGGDRPVYYGAMDVSLSPLGEQEAIVAADYLKQFKLQHVAASPLSRAIFGANEVLKRQTKDGTDDGGDSDDTELSELKIYDGFKELDRGSWCGKTKEEIGSDKMTKFDACDESVTPEGGESYPALKRRVLEARDELLDITDCGQASAVVSHLQVTRSMLSDALDIPTDQMYRFKIATASIACVDYNVETGEQVVHFQNFKPDAGLEKSKDGAN